MRTSIIDKKVQQIFRTTSTNAQSYFLRDLEQTEKTNTDGTKDFYTNADIQIEQLLVEKLSKQFPDTGFITEETKDTVIKEYNWIIDPLDGTKNFTRGIPIYAISVGLWKENEPHYGAIALPGIGEVVTSEMIQTNISPIPLKVPLVNMAFHTPDITQINKIEAKLGKIGIRVRNYYSIAFSGAMFIKGSLDALIMINQGIWDIAATVAMIKNAGIPYTKLTKDIDITKSTIRDYDKTFIAAHDEALLEKITSTIKQSL